MNDIHDLIERCRSLGATLTPVQGRLRVQAPHPLPDEVVAALKAAKSEVMAELERESHHNFECWILDEWRKTAIPAWRRILKESVQMGDSRRADYARWMLSEVLEDIEGGDR